MQTSVDILNEDVAALFFLKYSECGLCSREGCLNLKRDVQAENGESQMEMEHMPSPRRDTYIV